MTTAASKSPERCAVPGMGAPWVVGAVLGDRLNAIAQRDSVWHDTVFLERRSPVS